MWIPLISTLVGAGYYVLSNAATVGDDLVNGFSPDNLPFIDRGHAGGLSLNRHYFDMLVLYAAIGLGAGVLLRIATSVASNFHRDYSVVLFLGLGCLGFILDGQQVLKPLHSGCYFQALFHAATAATWGLIGALGALKAMRKSPAP